MKTIKINRIKYLYLVLLTSLLGTVSVVAQSQPVEYRDPSFNYLVGTTDSRMVLSIAETDSTVKLRVMMLGAAGVYTMSAHITFDDDVLTVTDTSFTNDVNYFTGDKIFYCVELSPGCAKSYPKFQPACSGVNDLQAGGMPSGGKYFLNHFTSTYMGPFREYECIAIPSRELYPTYNLCFKKKHKGVKIKKEDFGFMGDSLFGFDKQTYWGIPSLTLGVAPPVNEMLLRYVLPDLFVFRSPSDVETDHVSNVQFASATLNANYTRGNIPPANTIYISARNSYSQTGQLDWDTITHYGFLYATTNAKISVNDISKKITINGTEYPFPTSAEIAANGATGIEIGGIRFYFVEFPNNSPSQSINYNAEITGINTLTNEYYAWSYIRYAFETSDTYLLVGDPVRFNLILDCDAMNALSHTVTEDGSDSYTHNDASWDAIPISGVTLDSVFYSAPYATPPTGSTLNGVTFPVGQTRVLWTGWSDGNSGDCEILVTVNPTSFLECSLTPDRYVQEIANGAGYTKSGYDWDVQAQSGMVLTDSNYVFLSGAGVTPATGTTLNNALFQLGETTVRWYATLLSGAKDSCTFTVTVLPSDLVICPSNGNKKVMETLPAGYYTHTGDSWDIHASTDIPAPIAAQRYQLSGTAILASNTTLDGAQFPIGVTHVKYMVEAHYILPDQTVMVLFDTCEFTVTVAPFSLLNCATTAMTNKHLDENAPMQGYTHVGTSWDAVIDPAAIAAGLTVTRNYKIKIAGTTYTGASLHGFNFPVGVTLVKWYGTDQFGRLDSCQFNVTIDPLPIAVLDCSELSDQAVSSDFAGATIYTHHGITWDPKPGDIQLTTLTQLTYRLNGATTGTGDWTLDGVAFKLGKTNVTWIGKDQYGFVDSCKFVVSVIMTCPAEVVYEGGPYHITSLAGLCWTDNMANRNYANGDPIAFARAYHCNTCTDSIFNASIFGLLYTWYSAVNIPEGANTLPLADANGHVQGVCPDQFHVPSQAELDLLNLYPLADLKSTNYWIIPGTNATGFNSLPAGRYNSALNRFEDLYTFTGYWTSYAGSNMTALYQFITYYCEGVLTQETVKADGLSVRCIMNY